MDEEEEEEEDEEESEGEELERQAPAARGRKSWMAERESMVEKNASLRTMVYTLRQEGESRAFMFTVRFQYRLPLLCVSIVVCSFHFNITQANQRRFNMGKKVT